MNEIERKARELLEIEYRREDTTGGRMMADNLRDGETHGFEVELRAIIAALAPPEGYVLIQRVDAKRLVEWDTNSPGYELSCRRVAAMLAARPEVSQ